MKPYTSPILLRLLDKILPPDVHHLVGDMEEEFHQQKKDEGNIRAHLSLWFQVLRSAPWLLFQSLIWNIVMITNYLKVTWRNIKKHKSFSTINILGLALSMSVCLLIILFLIDQKSYDRFHENSDRIYRIISNYKSPYNNNSTLYATSPADLADKLQAGYPSIKQAVHVRGNYGGEIRVGNKTFTLQGMYSEPAFFDLFDFTLKKGDHKTALAEPGSIILTPKTAEKLFGDEDPMGKTIIGLGDQNYQVTGIIDTDVKTHFKFESLVSYSTLTSNPVSTEKLDDWQQSISNSYTYVLLKDGADPSHLESQLPGLIKTSYQDPEQKAVMKNFDLQPLTGIALGPPLSNEIGWVFPEIAGWFLIAFATIIILIACFNYISLTIARALNRGKEVGVRKVMGALRADIINQFLIESIIIAALALVFAAFFLQWLLPQFNSLFIINFSENQVHFSLLSDYWIYAVFLIFSVFIGILAGLYPAIYLSSFQPSRVLKGITGGRGFSAKSLRKSIIVVQFTISIVFIITSVILFNQFRFMVNSDPGFRHENIVNVALQDISYQRFENTYRQRPEVASIAATSKIPALNSIDGVWLKTDSVAERVRGHYFSINEDYIQTMELNLLAGRNFSAERGTDSTDAVILGKSAVEKLGLKSPATAIDKPVTLNEETYTVIGVIDDFISADPLRAGDPIILRYNPGYFLYAVIKTRPGQTSPFINHLQESWLNLGSTYSLKFNILDTELRANPLISVFSDFIKVLGMLAVFSIFISCLGLLGMAMYSAENRTKEIGIRKVLGASVRDIVLLLSKEYLFLIGIAVTIGTPVAWFINHLWLQSVSHKADITIYIYLIGIAGTIALALLTIGSQTIRAARAKSVENLQSE